MMAGFSGVKGLRRRYLAVSFSPESVCDGSDRRLDQALSLR